MDHKAFLQSLSVEEKVSLTKKSNQKGLKHLVAYGTLTIGCAIWVWQLAPFWPVAFVALAILLAFTFTLQHECTHDTPFQTRWLNSALGFLTGVILFQPFLWFRYFHLAHHRHTNDPGHDPELDGDGKPESWRDLIWHLSTVPYWSAKASVLWQNACSQEFARYIPASARPKIQREARFMLMIYIVAAVAIWFEPKVILIWLLPLAAGFPFLRLYLLAEHGRCAFIANMFENTRTTFTNRVIRFIAWNMPYHTEHHVFPNVPFHSLPALHRLMARHLQVTSSGYTEFARAYIKDFKSM